MTKKKSKVETIETQASTELPESFANHGKEYKLPILKEITLYPTCYPELKIEQWDLCQDMDEEVDLWISVGISLKKNDFFEFVKLVSSSFELWRDERIKTELKIRLLKDETKEAIKDPNSLHATKYGEEL